MATPSLLFPTQFASNRTSVDQTICFAQRNSALFKRPPASVFCSLVAILSEKVPGCRSLGSSGTSSTDRKDYSGCFNNDHARLQTTVEQRLARDAKRKRQRHDCHSTSGHPDSPAEPNVPISAKSRSRIEIADLINQSATTPPPSSVRVQKHGPSPVPCESPTTVIAPTVNTRLGLPVENYVLQIRQQPLYCKIVATSERDPKTVHPAPIIQLTVYDGDPHREWLQSPFFVMCVNLYDPVLNTPVFRPLEETLEGGLVSSLHKVCNQNNRENGYFVFNDLNIKLEGQFCLQFNLFEILNGAQFEFITSTLSDIVAVYSSKSLAGNFPSAILSHKFSIGADNEAAVVRQGVQLPTATGSERAMDASPPSSTATTTTALTTMSPPSSKLQKHVHGMEANQSRGANHTPPGQRESASPSNLSTSSYVSAYQSTRTSKRITPTSRRAHSRSDLKKRADGTDGIERKDYYCDRPRRYNFLRLLYFPRQEHQYYTPAHAFRRPHPPLPRMSLQQYEEHDRRTISDNDNRPCVLPLPSVVGTYHDARYRPRDMQYFQPLR